MQSTEQRPLDEMAREAESYIESNEYNEAEQLYREILRRRQEQEGIPATYKDMYNLCAVLFKNQKYEEALPFLRELFVCLSQRTTGRDRAEFIEMEEATARMLAQSLEGLRQRKMVDELQATQEGVDFSDSSDDDQEGGSARPDDEGSTMEVVDTEKH